MFFFQAKRAKVLSDSEGDSDESSPAKLSSSSMENGEVPSPIVMHSRLIQLLKLFPNKVSIYVNSFKYFDCWIHYSAAHWIRMAVT